MANFPKLTEQQIAPIIGYHVMITQESFQPDVPVNKAELSEKAKRAKELIHSSKFGCHTEAVAKLVSIILEESILPDAPKPSSILAGTVILNGKEGLYIVAAQNSDGSLRTQRADGTTRVGNNLRPQDITAATPAEIEFFFQKRHGLI